MENWKATSMKTPRLKPKKGWAVEIYGSDGEDDYQEPWISLADEGNGCPLVFDDTEGAELHLGDLTKQGFKARVVRVLYAEPIRI